MAKEETEIAIDGTLPRTLGLTRRELAAAARLFASLSGRRVGERFKSVTIVVQDDEASNEAHRGIMGVAGATDVITQRYDPIPPEEPGIYGELYVNAEQAGRCAGKVRGGAGRKWSARQEFLLYVAHGMDHLSGADDHSEQDYARMRRRELGWLRKAAEASGEGLR